MADLSELISKINKEFGAGALKLATAVKAKTYRSTGSIALDVALGGGWGRSTIIDVIGRQSCGKTLVFELAAVTAQRNEEKPSCLFDFEGTFDPKRFVALGGDLEQLFLVRADNFAAGQLMFLEWAADMLKAMLKNKMFACIGMDSTAAMVSKAEYDIKEEKGEEAATMAYTARGLSSVLRQIVGSGLILQSDVTLFFMSQMRDNLGGRSFKGQPPADKRTGGRALPFYAATQVEISRGDTFKADVEHEGGHEESDVEVGHETKVRVRKNKNNAKQGRVCSFDIYTEGDTVGLDAVAELCRLAVATGVIVKGGSWYEIPAPDEDGEGTRVQGKEGVYATVKAYPKLAKWLDRKTRQALDVQLSATAEPAEVIYGDAEPDEDEALIQKMLADDEERAATTAQ